MEELSLFDISIFIDIAIFFSYRKTNRALKKKSKYRENRYAAKYRDIFVCGTALPT